MFDAILNSYFLKGLKHDVGVNGESVFFGDFFSKYGILPKDCLFLDDSVDREGYIGGLGIDYVQISDSEHPLEILRGL